MILKIRFKILLILLIFQATVWAQGLLEAQLRYADSLLAAQKYFDAITEFKRLEFFDSTNRYRFEAEFKIALSYKAEENYCEAVPHFLQAIRNAENPAEKFNVQMLLIRNYILQRKIDEALNLISSLEKKADENQEYLLKYWRGWAYMFGGKWTRAFYTFKQMKENELAELCKKVVEEEYSVPLAKGLSYILPGAGQVYVGEYLSGVMSFGWNALWGYLTIKAFLAERVFDGIMIGNLLWFRFYRGNIQNAEKFSKQKNIEIYNKAYGYLENKFKGLKP